MKSWITIITFQGAIMQEHDVLIELKNLSVYI